MFFVDIQLPDEGIRVIGSWVAENRSDVVTRWGGKWFVNEEERSAPDTWSWIP